MFASNLRRFGCLGNLGTSSGARKALGGLVPVEGSREAAEALTKGPQDGARAGGAGLGWAGDAWPLGFAVSPSSPLFPTSPRPTPAPSRLFPLPTPFAGAILLD